jgi:glycosyltransferase involved in cell wall biosynthesis
MSSGKPIFAMIGSGAASLIQEYDCGFTVSPGNYSELAQIIRTNYKNTELLNKKGANARCAYEAEFTLEKGINNFEKIIN